MKKVPAILVSLYVIFGISLMFWMPVASWGISLLQHPQFDYNPLVWLEMFIINTYPIVYIVSMILSIAAYKCKRSTIFTISLALLPLLSMILCFGLSQGL